MTQENTEIKSEACTTKKHCVYSIVFKFLVLLGLVYLIYVARNLNSNQQQFTEVVSKLDTCNLELKNIQQKLSETQNTDCIGIKSEMEQLKFLVENNKLKPNESDTPDDQLKQAVENVITTGPVMPEPIANPATKSQVLFKLKAVSAYYEQQTKNYEDVRKKMKDFLAEANGYIDSTLAPDKIEKKSDQPEQKSLLKSSFKFFSKYIDVKNIEQEEKNKQANKLKSLIKDTKKALNNKNITHVKAVAQKIQSQTDCTSYGIFVTAIENLESFENTVSPAEEINATIKLIEN